MLTVQNKVRQYLGLQPLQRVRGEIALHVYLISCIEIKNLKKISNYSAPYSPPDMCSPRSSSNGDISASSGFVNRSVFRYLENSNNDARTGSLFVSRYVFAAVMFEY